MPNLLYPTTGGGDGAGATYEMECIVEDTTSVAYVTVIDISGPGLLYQMLMRQLPAQAGADHIRMTIDGTVELYTLPDNARHWTRFHNTEGSADIFYIIANEAYFYKPIWWKNGFKVEMKSDNVNTVYCKIHYGHG